MCIIIYSENGQIPRRHLRESLRVNPHGWGFMQPDGDGAVQIVKGISKTQFWKHWKERRQNTPIVFHARFATHGKMDCNACHPFAIPGHPGLGVAHNGIIHKHADPKSDFSDTQLFVKKILANLPKGFLNHSGVRKLMAEYIGYNKLVFLDAAGKVTFINENLGHWRDDRWYSNHSYVVATQPVGAFQFNPATWQIAKEKAEETVTEKDVSAQDKAKEPPKNNFGTGEPEWYKERKRQGWKWLNGNNGQYHVT